MFNLCPTCYIGIICLAVVVALFVVQEVKFNKEKKSRKK